MIHGSCIDLLSLLRMTRSGETPDDDTGGAAGYRLHSSGTAPRSASEVGAADGNVDGAVANSRSSAEMRSGTGEDVVIADVSNAFPSNSILPAGKVLPASRVGSGEQAPANQRRAAVTSTPSGSDRKKASAEPAAGAGGIHASATGAERDLLLSDGAAGEDGQAAANPINDVDHGLVERAREGDARAFQELVSRYQNRAFSVALGVVGRREDAEDVVQEAFLKAYRNLGSFRGQSSFYTWLYRIVFNLAIDLSRRRYRHAESSIGDNATMDAVAQHKPEDAGDLIGGIRGPEEEINRVALGKRLAEAIDGLSPNHRAVIILREVEGLSYQEISDVVGCSKGTVMSRLHHARKRLQRSLAEFVNWRTREGAESAEETGAHDDDGEDETFQAVEGEDEDPGIERSVQGRR